MISSSVTCTFLMFTKLLKTFPSCKLNLFFLEIGHNDTLVLGPNFQKFFTKLLRNTLASSLEEKGELCLFETIPFFFSIQ